MSHGHLLIMIRVYGLKNCDTCRKAIKHLKEANVAYDFCDFRRDGLEFVKIEEWERLLGYDSLLNRRGTTWRGLSQSDKADLNNEKAITLMFNNPALIKRPVFETKNKIVIGYTENQIKELGL